VSLAGVANAAQQFLAAGLVDEMEINLVPTLLGSGERFKVLMPEISRDNEEMHRFVRGMKTAMPLKHPNLIRIYGAGLTGGYCWVVPDAGLTSLKRQRRKIPFAGASGLSDRYADTQNGLRPA